MDIEKEHGDVNGKDSKVESKNKRKSRKKKLDEIFSLKDVYYKKDTASTNKCKKDAPHKFKKGNKMGVKFGNGQSIEGNGRPKKPETVVECMKIAAEKYGFSAVEIADQILKVGLDENIDPKVRFAFLKEANLRIFGTPSNSIEEAIKILNNRVDKIYELTIPMLEATAQSDGIKIVEELIKQGKLDEVLKMIEGRNEGV